MCYAEQNPRLNPNRRLEKCRNFSRDHAVKRSASCSPQKSPFAALGQRTWRQSYPSKVAAACSDTPPTAPMISLACVARKFRPIPLSVPANAPGQQRETRATENPSHLRFGKSKVQFLNCEEAKSWLIPPAKTDFCRQFPNGHG